MLQTLTGNIWTHKKVVNYTQLQSATPTLNIQGPVVAGAIGFGLNGVTATIDNGVVEINLSLEPNFNVALDTQFGSTGGLIALNCIATGLGGTFTVSVIGGNGTGQTNHVHLWYASGDSALFSFDDPWQVPIDNTSFLMFCRPDLNYQGKFTYVYDPSYGVGTSFTFNNSSTLSSTNGYYVGWTVSIQDGSTVYGAPSIVTYYNGSTKQFTISPANTQMITASTNANIFISRPDLTFAGFVAFSGHNSDLNADMYQFLGGEAGNTYIQTDELYPLYCPSTSDPNFYNGSTVSITSGTGVGSVASLIVPGNYLLNLLNPLPLDNTSVVELTRDYVYTFVGQVTGSISLGYFGLNQQGLYKNVADVQAIQDVTDATTPLLNIPDYYRGCVAFVLEGQGKGTSGIIIGYNPAGGISSFNVEFVVQPDTPYPEFPWVDNTSIIALFRPMIGVGGTVNQVIEGLTTFNFVDENSSWGSSHGGIDTASLSTVDNFYTGMDLRVISGTGTGNTNTVSGYQGSTNTFTVTNPWVLDETSVVSLTEYNSFTDIFIVGIPANHIIVDTKITTLTTFNAGLDSSGNQNRVFVVIGDSSILPATPTTEETVICSNINGSYGIGNLTIPVGTDETYDYGSFRWFTTSAPGTSTYARNALPPGTISSPTTVGSYCVPTRLDARDITARFCILNEGANTDLSNNIINLETGLNFNTNVTSGVAEIAIQYMVI